MRKIKRKLTSFSQISLLKQFTSFEDAIAKIDEVIVYKDSYMTDIAEQYIDE